MIVNTTPVGMYPDNGECLVDLSEFPACGGVIDVIYNPFQTALLAQAQDLGLPYSNGLPMLVAQATAAAELFLGEDGFQGENERIIRMLGEEIENLICFGGSVSDARQIAQSRGKTFVRLEDAALCEAAGKEKGQLLYVPENMALSPREKQALLQNGRAL